MKSYGQTAYDAYFKFSDGKSLISGTPLPTWEDQDQRIRDAWCKAGEAVTEQVNTENGNQAYLACDWKGVTDGIPSEKA